MSDTTQAAASTEEAAAPAKKEKKERKNLEVELHQIGSVICGRYLYAHPALYNHIAANGASARIASRSVSMVISGDRPTLANNGATLVFRSAAHPQNDFRWFTFAFESEELATEYAALYLKVIAALNEVPLPKQERGAKSTSIRRIA